MFFILLFNCDLFNNLARESIQNYRAYSMKNYEFFSKAILTTIILTGTVLSCKCGSGSRALDRHQHQQLKDPCRTPTILYGKLQLPDPFHI